MSYNMTINIARSPNFIKNGYIQGSYQVSPESPICQPYVIFWLILIQHIAEDDSAVFPGGTCPCQGQGRSYKYHPVSRIHRKWLYSRVISSKSSVPICQPFVILWLILIEHIADNDSVILSGQTCPCQGQGRSYKYNPVSLIHSKWVISCKSRVPNMSTLCYILAPFNYLSSGTCFI